MGMQARKGRTEKGTGKLTRRELLRLGAAAAGGLTASAALGGCGGDPAPAPSGTRGSATVRVTPGERLSDLVAMARGSAAGLGITGNALLGSTVFIKPNFVGLGILPDFLPESGECTKPEIVLAIAEQCLLAGAARVTIGDGAQGLSWSWERVRCLPGNTFHGTTNMAAGVACLNEMYGKRVELACLNELDQWEPIPSSSPDPLLADGLLVSRPFFQADHVISVPTLKAHQWADVTASMKNFLGVTPLFRYQVAGEPSRGALHVAYAGATCGGVERAGVEGAYTDIFRWRRSEGREDFAILDASIGLERNGPHAWGDTPLRGLPGAGGTTIDFKERSRGGNYFLLASDDLAAVDSVAMRITGYEVDRVKQLVIASNLGLGEIHNVWLQGASLAELTVPDWVRAEQLEEWGAPASAHASQGGSPSGECSRVFAGFSSLLCPTAAILLFRWLHGRRRESP